ncbi:calcium-binding protein [Providencia vermicola]|uniref:calcium-binding protein n=1 Tax=Providencia vermicola TaxID=333965 RepID=UPI003523C73D
MSLSDMLKKNMFSSDIYTKNLKQDETVSFLFRENYVNFSKTINGNKNNFLMEDVAIPIYINLMNKNIKLSNTECYEVRLKDVSNVILHGQTKSKVLLKGNKRANILDAGLIKTKINGYDGDDHLIFRAGVARGGNGDDSYYLRRFQWENTKSKPITKLSARIVETSKGKSKIHLGYSLDEITDVKLAGNDLALTISAKSPHNPSETLKLNVTLKNVYQDLDEGKVLNHDYQLYTRDGFRLDPILTNDSYKKSIEKFYEVSYLQNRDYLPREQSDRVIINKEKKHIMVNNHGYHAPMWGYFNLNGDIKNLRFTGSSQDDLVTMINKNSYIMVTKGNDIYQLKEDNFIISEVTFDFSELHGNHTGKESVIIKVSDGLGKDLMVDGQSIYFKNIFNDKKSRIKFINYEHNRLNLVYLKDANGNIYQIKLDPKGHKVIVGNPVSELTQQSDDIYLLRGQACPEGVFDTLAGDDKIKDFSGGGIIINAGDGNDNVKALKGINVLYGGNGDDVIDGGSQGDLLLSDLGNDLLKGGWGNDEYIVDGSIGMGTTIIDDDNGINNIHLMHFNKAYTIVEEENSKYQVYTSKSQLREVKIKYFPENEGRKNNIHHYDSLPQHIPNDVKESMSYMVRYLAEHQQYWKREKPLLPWQPMYAFKGFFKNTSHDFIDMSKENIIINQGESFGELVLNINGKSSVLMDESGHGRYFKVDVEKGSISLSKNKLSNNVFDARGGTASLHGGAGDDVFIINGHNGEIHDKKGDNVFIIDGGVRGESTIDYGNGTNEIYLISFNETPVILKENNENKITQYIYQSESGYKVTINQADGVEAPIIIHRNLLPGMREYTTQQKLEYLGNALATMRLQDEYNSHGVNNIKSEWNPASLVRVFMDKGTAI